LMSIGKTTSGFMSSLTVTVAVVLVLLTSVAGLV
jgi:hypothetical protein